MASALDCKTVAVSSGPSAYCEDPPFSPAERWPEYPFAEPEHLGRPNAAYAGVRECLRLLELDQRRFDTPDWNPFEGIIRPDDTVVLKPNFVRDFRESSPDHANCLITHGSIIRAVLDYAFIALKGRGRLVVADAPHNDADFDRIRSIAGLDEIREFYQAQTGFEIEVYDLRPERAEKIDGVIVGHVALPGDPAGYVRVNLGLRSAFVEINDLCHLLYGSEYDTSELVSHHHDDVHEYLISQTVLDADVVLSVPKLKTHKKVGLTVNMKNLVGINGNKNWLPHHREGTPRQGGDQFASNGLKRKLERSVVSRFKRAFPLLGPFRKMVAGPIKAIGKRVFGDTNAGTIRSGNWYGNDTTWRMVHDLNRILMYADKAGAIRDRSMRRFFSVVDGIVAGEGNGPLDPTPKPTGAVLAGGNAVAIDLVCARLMGFDYSRLPVLARALRSPSLPLVAFSYEDILSVSNEGGLNGTVAESSAWDVAFEPHFGWKGHIELSAVAGLGGP